MIQRQKQVPASGLIILILVLGSAIALKEGYTGSGKWYCFFMLTLTLILLARVNIRKKKNSI
jgi:hypothetical protein